MLLMYLLLLPMSSSSRISAVAAAGGATCTSITATDTNPDMKWVCQGNGIRSCSNKHIACTPAAHYNEAQQDDGGEAGLVIFLPGTYLTPQDYSDIIAEFAYHGYLALGLFYPSAEGQNGCGASRHSNPTDLNCTARERFKVLTGDDNGGYTNITAPDSIVERSAAALKYLGAPWSRYLDPTTNAVRWSDVIIAGHSNGADHAGFLSKNYNVSRALMFAGPNDSVGARGSDGYYSAAPWVYRNWTSNVTGEVATPPERLYGFGVCGYRVTPPPSPLTTTWQVFEDYTNIYDREPSPTNVTHGTLKFVGLFDTATECFAAVNATSAKDGPYHSWTWNDAVKTTSPAYANHCWGDTSMTWQGRGDAPGQVSGRGPGFPANPPPVQHPSDGECWAWLPNWSVAMGMPGPWYKADNVTALADPKTFVGVHHACSSGMVPHGSSGDGYNHMASAADCCMPRFPANFSSPPALAGRILWTNIILNMLTGSPYAAGAGGGGGGGDGGGSSNNTASCACVA